MGQGARRWGFLGSGKMATALARGMVSAGVAEAAKMTAFDPIPAAAEALAKEAGVSVAAGNREVAAASDAIILAVKPQVVPAVLAEVRGAVTPDHLFISIAAGVTLGTLESGLGPGLRLARVMPNTPALLGEGASGYCLSAGCRPEDEEAVRACLDAVGRSWRLPESLLDAVTGLSGSGPAFVYTIIEALSDGGVAAGLPRDVATGLAAQTVLGSARMVLETGKHTGALKDEVTSPGGTTIAGIRALEAGGVRAALMDAVAAAAGRSKQLAEEAEAKAKAAKAG